MALIRKLDIQVHITKHGDHCVEYYSVLRALVKNVLSDIHNGEPLDLPKAMPLQHAPSFGVFPGFTKSRREKQSYGYATYEAAQLVQRAYRARKFMRAFRHAAQLLLLAERTRSAAGIRPRRRSRVRRPEDDNYDEHVDEQVVSGNESHSGSTPAGVPGVGPDRGEQNVDGASADEE